MKEIFFSSETRTLVLGPTECYINCVIRVLSPGTKRLEIEADHSPPTSGEVTNEWSYIATAPYALGTRGGAVG